MNDDEIEALLREAVRREPTADDPAIAPLVEKMPAARVDAIVRAVSPRRAPVSRARVAGVVAFAAIVLALVGASTIRDSSLPEYTMTFAGDRAAVRADGPHEAADVHLGKGAALDLVLRPETRSREPVVAHFVLVRAGKAEAWAPPREVDAGGGVRVHGPREALFREPNGTYVVVAAVCPASTSTPPAPETLAKGEAPRGCRVTKGSVVFDE